MKSLIATILLASLAGAHAGNASAGDPEAGKAKAQAVCQTCHGLDGQGILIDSPHLSGQKEQYLIIQLKAYRSGQRQHPQMSIIAGMLSDEDIANVASWYSNIRVSVEKPD